MNNIIYLRDQICYQTKSEKEVDKERLKKMVILNIARNNIKSAETIKRYHEEEIGKICDYIIELLGGTYVDVRMLNACFHSAISELKINCEELLTKKVSNKEQVAIKLAM